MSIKIKKRITSGDAAAFPSDSGYGPKGLTKREHFALYFTGIFANKISDAGPISTTNPQLAVELGVQHADLLIDQLNYTPPVENGGANG